MPTVDSILGPPPRKRIEDVLGPLPEDPASTVEGILGPPPARLEPTPAPFEPSSPGGAMGVMKELPGAALETLGTAGKALVVGTTKGVGSAGLGLSQFGDAKIAGGMSEAEILAQLADRYPEDTALRADADKASQRSFQQRQKALQFYDKVTGSTKKWEEDVNRFRQEIPSSSPLLGLAENAFIMVEAAAASALGGPAGAYTGYAAMTANESAAFYKETFEQLKKAGLDEQTADKYASEYAAKYGMLSGAVEYASNAYQLKGWLKGLKGTQAQDATIDALKKTGAFKQILKILPRGISEGLEELGQGGISNHMKKKMAEQIASEQGVRAGLEGENLGESFKQGAGVGLLMATLGLPVEAGAIQSQAKEKGAVEGSPTIEAPEADKEIQAAAKTKESPLTEKVVQPGVTTPEGRPVTLEQEVVSDDRGQPVKEAKSRSTEELKQAEQPIAKPTPDEAVSSYSAKPPKSARAVQPSTSSDVEGTNVRTFVMDDGKTTVRGEFVTEDENTVTISTGPNKTRTLNKKFWSEQGPAQKEEAAAPSQTPAPSGVYAVEGTRTTNKSSKEQVQTAAEEVGAVYGGVFPTEEGDVHTIRVSETGGNIAMEGDQTFREAHIEHLRRFLKGHLRQSREHPDRTPILSPEQEKAVVDQLRRYKEAEEVETVSVSQTAADESQTELPRTDESQRADPALEERSRQLRKAGYVGVPDRAGASRIVRQAGRLIRRKFTRTRGMDADTHASTIERKHAREAAKLVGQATRQDFQRARARLIKKHDKQKVGQWMQDVVYGEKTIDEFRNEFGLPRDHIAVRALNGFNIQRRANSQRLAQLLEEQGAPADLVAKVAENDYYVSRFYLKHLLGDEFVPKQEDYDAAVMEIQAGIEESLENLVESATKARGKQRRTTIDIVGYLQTRDATMLEGMSDSRREQIQRVANKFDKLSQVIESIAYDEDGNVRVEPNTDALLDAAQSTVDYFLNREQAGGGAIDTSNLKKRFLEGAFRVLYQEVTDPQFAAAKTIESQELLIANMTMFNLLARNGRGKVWTDFRSREAGTEVPLGEATNPADKMKYGKLAGKYVTKELHDAVTGGTKPGWIRSNLWFKPMGVMRGLKLLGPKTIGRNYTEAYVGFAVGSGDALRKGYGKNIRKAHALAGDFVARKPKALREVSELVKKGVFSLRGNTQAEEVLNLLTTDPRNWAGQKFQRAMELYSIIDFPTKIAAYWSALDRGMTEAQAVEHVRKFYQNPESVPEFTHGLSRTGITDYVGYFVDSIRIRANQVRHAMDSAKKGDFVPMVGLTTSASIDTLRRTGKIALISTGLKGAWVAIQQAIRDDDDEIDKVELLEDGGRQTALREFMPDWYQDAPLIVWEETKKDGGRAVFYTALGGNSAFPLEDMIYGALQAEESDIEAPANVLKQVWRDKINPLRPGMYPSALYKWFTGDSLGGDYKSTGIQDVLVGEHPRKSEIIREATINLGLDVLGGQFGPKVTQTRAIGRKQSGDVEPRAGTYTPYRSVREVWTSLANPTRTYGIDKNEASILVRNKVVGLRDALRASKGMVSMREKALRNLGDSTAYLDKSAGLGQAKRYEYLKKAEGVFKNAQTAFGGILKDHEIEAILKDGMDVSADEAKAVRYGKVDNLRKYRPDPRKTALQRGSSSRSRRRPSAPKRRAPAFP